LTCPQKNVILKNAIDSENLYELDLDSVDLSDINDELIVKGLARRKSVCLNNTNLTYGQLVRVLKSLPVSQISELILSGMDLSELPENFLCLSVSKVRSLDMSNTHLTGDQLSAILCECIWSNSIENLNLTGANFADVSSQLLMDSFACLTKLNLCSAHLSRKQLFAVLYSLTLDSSTLELLDLSAQDLSSLPANLLFQSLGNLKTLNLNYTKTSTEQLTAILRSIVRSKSVTTLELVRLELTDVPVVDLIRPISHLKIMNLNYSKLTSEQTISLLTSASRSQTLEHIGLVRSNLKPVPLHILKKAMKTVRSVALNYSQTTVEQKEIIKRR